MLTVKKAIQILQNTSGSSQALIDELKTYPQNYIVDLCITTYEISPSGKKKFVPYDKQDFGEIHNFISPSINRYHHMKWTKTHEWKNQKAAKKSKWKYHPTFGGLNTVSK